jgi:hypothetical protein
MQHGDFNKTKVLKTQRDSMSDVKKSNSKSVLKSVIPVRPVGPIQEQVRSTGLIRSLYRLPEPFAGQAQYWTRLVQQTIWPLEFELHWTSPVITRHVRVLTQICQVREFHLESALSPVGVTILVWPVWWTSLIGWVWQLQRLVFQILYKRHSTPTLVGC